MLLLIFEVGDGRYALATSQIVEIVPLVKLEQIPVAPDFVAGLMNYRGRPVPVIDLCCLLHGQSCEKKLSTRIILVHYPFATGQNDMLGMIAEKVTKTLKSNLNKVPSSGVVMDNAFHQNDMDFKTGAVIQWFDLNKILPENEISKLFKG